jgi:citrate lyase subunit beta/citryl-CoA lyase
MTIRLRRCELAVPASNERMLAKAAASGVDLAFLDLEDAVAPNEKESARAKAITALREHNWGRTIRAVRINGIETRWCLDDLLAVVRGAAGHLDVIIVPKVSDARDVWFVATVLDQLEPQLHIQRPIGIEALIEDVRALVNVDTIATSSSRLEALILGYGDFSASQGVRMGAPAVPDASYPGDMWHYARVRTLVAARNAGIDCVDGPYADIRDIDGYRAQAGSAAMLGFGGKWAIHPSQIAPAHEIFSPTEMEIAYATRVRDGYAEACARGEGATSIDGRLVDAASVRMMRPILDRAEAIGS